MIEDRPEVLTSLKEVEETISNLVESGHASDEVPKLWRLHFFQNGYRVDGDQIVDTHRKDWFPGLSDKHRQDLREISDGIITERGLQGEMLRIDQYLALKKTKIEEEVDLGRAIYSIALGGPYHHSIIFSKSAEGSNAERSLMLYHMTTHLTNPTHLPPGVFNMAIEFKRDHIQSAFMDELSQKIEKEADDAAAMELFREYAADTYFSSLPSEAIRGGRQLQPPTIRQLLVEKYGEDRAKMGFLKRVRTENPEKTLLDKSLPYTESLRVIKADDQEGRFTYLAGEDEEGNLWRRWIPGNVVLSHLSLQTKDVAAVSRDLLNRYQDLEPLIKPAEVRKVRQLLTESILNQQDIKTQPNFLE